MRRIAQGLVVAGLALAMASPVLAQQGKGQFKGQGKGQGKGFGGGFGMMGQGGMMGGALQLLANSGVQKELKLSDEQVKQATDAVAEQRDKMRERMQELGQDTTPEARREAMTKIQASATKAAEEILNPDQKKRFEQIRLQSMGAGAFLSPKVAEELKITDDQKEKLREIQQAGRPQGAPGGGAQGDFQAMMTRMQELRKETYEKAHGVLTDTQKASWKEMTGEPFEVKFEMPARRRID